MKIIAPSFVIDTPVAGASFSRADGISLLRFIEQQARISHRAEDRQTFDSWEKFIQAVVLQHGDWSVVEHASITVTMRVDRGITHELVRHRLFSFTQESTRFVNYKKRGRDIEFILPADLPEKAHWFWKDAVGLAEKNYLTMLDEGATPQQARSVLPNATAATIAVTGNLRNWRHFLLMRTSKETHADFRRVTIPLLAKFKEIIPLLYDDIEPNRRQIDNLKQAR